MNLKRYTVSFISLNYRSRSRKNLAGFTKEFTSVVGTLLQRSIKLYDCPLLEFLVTEDAPGKEDLEEGIGPLVDE